MGEKMSTQNISLLRETTPHGNALFPFMLYDMASNPAFEERIGCHWHEEIEFLVITRGEGCVQLNGRSYPVKQNDICLILSNQLHLLTCPEQNPLDFFAIVFHPDFLRSLSRDTIQKKYIEPLLSGATDSCILHADTAGTAQEQNLAQADTAWAQNFVQADSAWTQNLVPADSAQAQNLVPTGTTQAQNLALADSAWEQSLLQCLIQIRQAFHTKAYAYELFIRIRLLEAFHLLATHILPAKSQTTDNSSHPIVLAKSMMEYLRANYDSEITLEQLEKAFCLSGGHICRVFKAMTHMTPFAYLNYCRIQQSMELLEHSDDEISLIATKCGFNNISYYNRTFQKYMHMTPSAYRKMPAAQSNNISSTVTNTYPSFSSSSTT